jgi:hypothetical protein
VLLVVSSALAKSRLGLPWFDVDVDVDVVDAVDVFDRYVFVNTPLEIRLVRTGASDFRYKKRAVLPDTKSARFYHLVSEEDPERGFMRRHIIEINKHRPVAYNWPLDLISLLLLSDSLTDFIHTDLITD